MKMLFLAMFALVLVGCQAENDGEAPALPPTMPEPNPAPVVDMHTSRNALDWAGTYEGLLACTDCAGVHTRLTLESDGRFQLLTRRLVHGEGPSESDGQFVWETGDNIIMLTTPAGQQRFAVGEGRLLMMDPGQSQPAWGRANAVLAQENPAWRPRGQGLAEMIVDHRWILVEAMDPANQPLEVLFPDPERTFVFNFAESRVHVEGGCNGLRAAYRIDAEGLLEISGAMSTMMACPDSLMEADAALSALMAGPLETVLVRGVPPRLVVLAASGQTLVLSGELTPEARFGPPATVFLEVDSELVACEDSVRDDGLCLKVRELSFDEQGIPAGEPGQWQALGAEIQGFGHEAGLRSVLRVKRFDPPAEPDMPRSPVLVLDLMVQSELVPE